MSTKTDLTNVDILKTLLYNKYNKRKDKNYIATVIGIIGIVLSIITTIIFCVAVFSAIFIEFLPSVEYVTYLMFKFDLF